jgi:periplasmic protein CpxP/Spy
MKYITIIILMMALAVSAAVAQDNDKTKKTPEEKATILTAKMEKNLALTPEQVKKVKAINLSSAEKTVASRDAAGEDKKKFHAEKKKIEEERDASFKSVLTPEQYTKYREMIEEKKDKKKDAGKKRGA